MVTETTLETEKPPQRVSRRDFLKYGAGVAAVAAGATSLLGSIPSLSPPTTRPSWFLQDTPASNIEEATISQLQAQMAAGTLSALSLVNMYEARINAWTPTAPSSTRSSNSTPTPRPSPNNSTLNAKPAKFSAPSSAYQSC